MEENNSGSASNESQLRRSEKFEDEKPLTRTPIIDSILDGSNSRVEKSSSNLSVVILREFREQFVDVPIDNEICAGIVARLLSSQSKNRFSSRELNTVAKSVANAMMAHPSTRRRIEKLWQSLSKVQ